MKDASWDFPISFRTDRQVSVMPDDVQMVLFAPRPARWLRLTLLEPFPGQSWTVAELDVFGQASAGPIFQPPRFADPSSFEVAERRLLREADRHPESDAARPALRELYSSHGAAERLAAIDRMERARFSPAVPLGWRFGTPLELVGYDRKSVGRREVESRITGRRSGACRSTTRPSCTCADRAAAPERLRSRGCRTSDQ